MTYYRRHLFFCTNRRASGAQGCGDCNAAELRGELKSRAKQLGLDGRGGVRINAAGCLGRCGDGPVIVVYPDAVWYSYVDMEDLEEILQTHLLTGRVVERLRLPDGPVPLR